MNVYYGYNIGGGGSTELRFDLFNMMKNTRGDCQDFAAYLECQARSVGIPDVQKIHLGGTQFNGGFTFPAVKRAGTTTFQAGEFNFHQRTYWSTGGGIYDWAIGFQSGGTPDWTLALGSSQAQELSALVLTGTPTFSTAFAINDVDPVFMLPTLLGSFPGP